MSDGQNPTLTRMAELEVRVERLEGKEREMSEVNVAAAEHPGNTVAERGETVSLREELVNAAQDTKSDVVETTTFFAVSDADLRAIEAAIRESATAPLRAEVEWLTTQNSKCMETIDHAIIRDQRLTADYDALKARAERDVAEARRVTDAVLAEKVALAGNYLALRGRADALRDAAKHHHECWEGDYGLDWDDFGLAIELYDAADRAGDTQDEATEGRGHGEPAGIPDRDHVGCDGGHPCGGDPVAAAAPSPTDAAADEPTTDDTYAYLQRQIDMQRKVWEDLERWREDVDFHMTNICRFRDSMVPALARANLRILSLEQRLSDLDKSRRTITATLEQNKGVFEPWANHIDQQIKNADDRFSHQDNAIEAVLIGLGCDLVPYGDPPKMSREQIIAALEARQGGVPEVVTDEDIEAYAGYSGISDMERASIRAGLLAVFTRRSRAALAVMGGGK